MNDFARAGKDLRGDSWALEYSRGWNCYAPLLRLAFFLGVVTRLFRNHSERRRIWTGEKTSVFSCGYTCCVVVVAGAIVNWGHDAGWGFGFLPGRCGLVMLLGASAPDGILRYICGGINV